MRLTPFRMMCMQASAAVRQTARKQKINKYMVHIYDEATSRETKPIAILFAWLMAREKHFSR